MSLSYSKTGVISLPPFGTLGLNPPRMWILAQGIVGPKSVFRLPVQIPADPRLVGQTAFFQALVVAPPTFSTGALSNRVKVYLQK